MRVPVKELDEYLGVELGRRIDGHPIFKWKNSDDLFWPAFATGQKVLHRVEIPLLKPVEVPCPECDGLGTVTEEAYEDDAHIAVCATCGGKGSVTKTSETAETAVPEYRRDRQMRQLNTWVITKWLDSEELIWGWIGRHGGEVRPTNHPPHEHLVDLWNQRFPGADFPHNGWRIPTNASLPSAPNGNREPNWDDTRRFVALLKEQTRLGFDERLKDMLASEDRIEAAKTKEIEDCVRDSFPAFLSPKAGSKDNFVSFPWTKRDRAR